MSEQTVDEQRRILEAFAEAHNASIEQWAEWLSEDAEACLEAESASPEQCTLARELIALVQSFQALAGAGRHREAAHEAFLAGIAHERLRWLPTAGPAEDGQKHGIHYRGAWVRCRRIESRVLSCMSTSSRVPLADVYRTVWGRPYVRRHRATIDMALSRLNRAMCDAGVVVSFHVRNGVVIAE